MSDQITDDTITPNVTDLIAWKLKQNLEAAQSDHEYQVRLALQELYHFGEVDVMMEDGEMMFKYRCADPTNAPAENNNIVDTSISEPDNRSFIQWTYGEDDE
tara:strand:- start:943 stop:1248 length:306 start_codon:yes stop_codon:yes gene_type:complete